MTYYKITACVKQEETVVFLKEFIKTISWLIVTNFQSKGDYLTVNILTDREIQCDYSSCHDLI